MREVIGIIGLLWTSTWVFASLRSAHDARADPVTPGLQLVSGRSAEGVGGTEHNGVPVGHQHASQFPSGRGLTGIYVRHDTDISATIQRDSACHGQFILAGGDARGYFKLRQSSCSCRAGPRAGFTTSFRLCGS